MSEQTPESVDLNVDEEKMEAWDEVKSDYEVEPGGQPRPNVMDEAETSTAERGRRGLLTATPRVTRKGSATPAR